MPSSANQLIHEKSPYLLQHAYNPVNWYPWGTAAFEKSKMENKPILLSIGYSTCHWCHVMEQESFEDPQTAALMNEHFVCIKLDREERPDIDHIYMMAVSAMTGQGGWPLNVFLTPDQNPFYGGTYFPPEGRYGMPGFKDVLRSIHQSWETQPQRLLESAQQLIDAIKQRQHQVVSQKKQLSSLIFDQAYQAFWGQFDSQFGGFGQQPKFPSTHQLSFLLRYWKRTGEPRALEMVEKTLQSMSQGGIFDQLAGGFHRYSTDERWQIPHFEKMLYDQAIIAKTALETYQVTQQELYARIAVEIFDYVLTEMLSSLGGFYCAYDADSLEPHQPSKGGHPEKKEGAFFLWEFNELLDLLGKEEGAIVNYFFGVEKEGNAYYDPHGEFVQKNILYQNKNVQQTADYFKKSVVDIEQILSRAKQKLRQVRSLRPRPHLDDKVLVDWNGLMISSLAFGFAVLQDQRYLQAAERAVEFIDQYLVDPQGYLWHRYRDQQSGIRATLSDYAFLIHGLLDLFEVTFKKEYLQKASDLAQKMFALFWDDQSGGFFINGEGEEKLILRAKEIYDGAIPSGNSMAALNLIRLYHLTLQPFYKEKVELLFNAFASEVNLHPTGYAQFLIAYDFYVGPAKEIVVVSLSEQKKLAQTFLNAIQTTFIPNKVIVYRSLDSTYSNEFKGMIPMIEHKTLVNNQAAVYICQDHVCQRPVTKMDELKVLLRE